MKEIRIIVARVEIDRWEEQEREMVPGSTIDTCRVCEGSVWLSPEGHRFAYVDRPDDSEIICVDCHLQLEVERQAKNPKAEDIELRMVPGSDVPQEYARRYKKWSEREIKKGVEERDDHS